MNRSKQNLIVPFVLLASLSLWLWPFVAGYGTSAFWGTFDIYGTFNCFAYYSDFVLHHNHTLPLWNPLIFGGCPALANPSALLAYPPNLVRSLLNSDPSPFSTLVSIYITVFLHLVLAATTTYYFARRRQRLSVPASYAAAFIFVLSACMSRKITAQWVHVTVVAWVPLIFLQLHDIVMARTFRLKLTHAIVCGLAFGMTLLGGFPQIAFCVPPLGLAYVSALVALRRRARSLRQAGLSVFACLVALVLAGLVSMALVLPAAEYAPLSPRSGSFALADGTDFHYTPVQLLKYLTSYPGGNIHRDVRAAGAIAVFLAIMGLLHRRRRALMPVLAALLVGLDLSLGEPLPFSSLMIRFAPYQIVCCSRTMVLTCFPLGLLAGFGLDAVISQAKTNPRRIGRSMFQMLTAVPILAGAYLGIVEPHYASMQSQDHVLLLLLAPVVAVTLCVIAGWMRSGKIMATGITLALLAEVVCWNAFLVPNLIQIQYSTAFEATAQCTEDLPTSNHRTSTAPLNTNLYQLQASVGGHDAIYVLQSRQVICPPSMEKTYTRLLKSSESMKSNVRNTLLFKRFFWLARHHVRTPMPPKNVAFPPCTTAFLDEKPEGVPSIPAAKVKGRAVSDNVQAIPLVVSENRAAVPITDKPIVFDNVCLQERHSALYLTLTGKGRSRLFVTFEDLQTHKHYPGFAKEVALVKTRARTFEIPLLDFQEMRIIVRARALEESSSVFVHKAFILSDLNDENNLIKIEKFTPNTCELRVGPLDGPRVLSFLDSAYPGWKATVDGQQVPLLRAFEGFKAIELKEGTHSVKFMFRPASVFIGWTISISASLLALLVLYWLYAKKVRGSYDENVP